MAHHEQHHDHHDHHHHLTFTEEERRLWRMPPGSRTECVDHQIAFKKCVAERSEGGIWPFSWIWATHWSDRWLCAHEKHAIDECEMGIAAKTFARNRDIINSRN